MAWRAHLLDRLRRQAVASGDPALFALHEELAAYPSEGRGCSPDLEAGKIAVPLRVRTDEGELALISTATSFGTAIDVTDSELSIEAFFPANEATASALQAGRAAAPPVLTGHSFRPRRSVCRESRRVGWRKAMGVAPARVATSRRRGAKCAGASAARKG